MYGFVAELTIYMNWIDINIMKYCIFIWHSVRVSENQQHLTVLQGIHFDAMLNLASPLFIIFSHQILKTNKNKKNKIKEQSLHWSYTISVQ